MERTVASLDPGTPFRIHFTAFGGTEYADYRLIYANQCRAYVEPLDSRTRQIVNGEGDVLAEVADKRGRINIAPMTVCTILEGRTMTTTEGKPVALKRGDRSFPAKVQERPVRQNTTRAKMLEFMLAELGEVNINDVMKTFDMERGLVIAHIHEMHKCHGYGYSIVGDMITITDPVVAEDIGDLL